MSQSYSNDTSESSSGDSSEGSLEASDRLERETFKSIEDILLDMCAFLRHTLASIRTSGTNSHISCTGNRENTEGNENKFMPGLESSFSHESYIGMRQTETETDDTDGGIDKVDIDFETAADTHAHAFKPSVCQISNSEHSSSPQTPTTATQQQSQSVCIDDLMYVLRNAHTVDEAKKLDSFIWHVWLAHTDVRVNKEMRDGICHMRRGNWSDAMRCFNRASVIDSTFPEAKNKVLS